MTSAPATRPRPTTAILIRPDSIAPMNSVCSLTRLTMTMWSASMAARSAYTGHPSASPIFTGSMRSWMGAPRVSGVCPRCLSTSICPAAVPPPWLPIAGRMTGVAPFCFTAATTAPSTSRMQPTPRLPAVTSTVWPGLTPLSRPARSSLVEGAAPGIEPRFGREPLVDQVQRRQVHWRSAFHGVSV